MKNKYHPLLKQKYFLGILSDREREQVNSRTLYSWAHVNEKELIGYSPHDPLVAEREAFAFMHKHEHVRKLLKVYMALYNCFQEIVHTTKDIVRNIKKHKNILVKTYEQCRTLLNAAEFENLTGISTKTILRWRNEVHCQKSFLELCRSKHAAQLTFEEQKTVFEELRSPANETVFICDIWSRLARTGQLRCKLGTFYKYARIAVQKFNLRKKKSKKHINPVRAKSPLSILHMDCTVVRTGDGGKWSLHIIYDNFSKAILGIKALHNPNSAETAQNLEEVINRYSLHSKKILLYCDGGPENKGMVDALLTNYPNIKKMVNSFSNGIHNNMIESFNSRFKRKLGQRLDLSVHEKVPAQLEEFKQAYNNMSQALIGTLTPNEVLDGKRPWKDLWPGIENNIRKAKRERVIINRSLCCKLPQ
ncbi:MAG: hypothetical protein ACXVC6_01575 [Bacteroidia bacterium]